jgi:hypothetical protein
VPPGVAQVSPVIVQSAFVQQFAWEMHVPLAVQPFWPVGHWHVPPGLEHVSPEIEQSVFVQHADDGMHWLFAPHAFCPTGQVHWAPGLAHVSPVTVQSVDVQQAPMAMHVSPAKQDFLLGGQLRTHELLWHTWSAPQALPHVPQLDESFVRLAQVDPASPTGGHVTSGGLQLAEQLPPEQT